MKARRQMTSQERKIMDKEIQKHCVEVSDQFELDYDTAQIFALYTYLGLGKKRITEFHKHMVKVRNELKEFYCADDKDPDIHFFAMRQKLKEKGIDVEAIREEVMREAEG
jgi:hypothetical protein